MVNAVLIRKDEMCAYVHIRNQHCYNKSTQLLTLSSIASWPLASALKKVRRDGIALATN